MISKFKIVWVDSGRDPKCPPNPKFPFGMDVDISNKQEATCSTPLAYPTKRCGYYRIECLACGMSVVVTTAGRVDDPRSIKVACKRPEKGKVQ